MARVILSLFVMIVAGACSSTSTTQRDKQEYFYHTVGQQGETLSAISRWYTGASSNWQFLLRHNPDLDPQRMQVGDQVRIPKGWLVTTKPMPYYTQQRPVIKRPVPDAVGTGVDYGGAPPADQGQAEPVNPAPAGRNEWAIEPSSPSAPVIRSPQTGGGDPEVEERRKRIRDQLLDDMLQ